jgi:hypothetical protein
MTNLKDLTTTQLNQILALKEQIETLQSQLDSIAGGGEGETPTPLAEEDPGRGRRSAAVRARMSAAPKARWAKRKGTETVDSGPVKQKRKLSASHRRKLIKALAKARKMRWAKRKGTASTSKPAKKGKRRISAAGRAAMSAAGKARWAKQKGTTTTSQAG